MNKRKLFLILSGAMALISVSPVSALIDISASGGYTNFKIKDNGSPLIKQSEESFSGGTLGAAVHLSFSVPGLLAIGVGPYLTYAPNLAFTGENTLVTYKSSLMRVGGEVKAGLLIIPFLTPYAKFGMGSDTMTSTATVVGVSTDLKYSGLQYQLVAGLSFGVVPGMQIFAEAGYTKATYDVTFSGTTISKVTADGYVLAAGVIFGI